MRTLVIGEAGSCHDGSLEKAIRLVALGASVGADAVKFQWTSSAARLAERRHAPEYLAAYKLIEHPVAWHGELYQACTRAGLEYMTTVYLPEDVAVIAPWVKRFKVASFEAAERSFIEIHKPFKKEVLISLGMGGRPYLGYIYDNFNYIDGMRLRYLHCVSAYPTPVDQIGLREVRQCNHDCEGMWAPAGLSDHTVHPWTGALAVAAGAEIIEFHFRLADTDPANADYVVARSPLQAFEYVQNIRLAEKMVGDGIKRIMPCEEKMLKYRTLDADRTATD